MKGMWHFYDGLLRNPLFLTVCEKGDKKDALQDPTKIPDESVTSNIPRDESNTPSDVKDEGFKVPAETPAGEKPTITIDVSKVTYKSSSV
jgi:hypothetical protein